MKQPFIIIVYAIFALSSCSRLDIEEGTPACVEEKIKDFNKSSICDDANVNAYTFQGNTVYVFNPGTCGADMTAEVINSDCSSLGYLGGITGNTKINGEEFSHAKFIKTIWEK